jgi:hypothetical protein
MKLRTTVVRSRATTDSVQPKHESRKASKQEGRKVERQEKENSQQEQARDKTGGE